MMSGTRSPKTWIAALLWRSYWGLPTAMVVVALPIVALLLHLDGNGASNAVETLGWPFDFGGSAAQEMASTLVTLYGALVTLYFSISLLVLTLAAGNLGVRLVDRWLSRRTTRLTLGFMLVGLVWSLLVLFCVDPDAKSAHVARGAITVLVALTVPLLCWLSYALHDLGRTIHVDTAIASIGNDATKQALPYDSACKGGPDPDWSAAMPIAARRSGYVETIDLIALARFAGEHDALVRIEKQPGAFVMKGEAMASALGCDEEARREMSRKFAIGSFRSSPQGAVFFVRLLVEIAARALSPAVNDFYTARACADTLGPVMLAHARLAQAPLWIGDPSGGARVLIASGPFSEIFDAPLAALRQSACAYPAVATRLLEIYGRVLDHEIAPQAASLLREHRHMLLDHARTKAETDTDRDALTRAADYA